MERFEELVEFIEEKIPYNRFVGLKVESVKPGYARLRLPFRKEFIGDTRRPALHGGVLSMLIDTCGGVALWSHCSPADRIATIDMRVDYLRPGPEDDLLAEGWVELMGNRVGNVAIKVVGAKTPDTVVAQGRAVYNIRREGEC